MDKLRAGRPEKPMITTIDIRHFRGIRQARLEGLDRVNLLTGPPGAGRSDVLEAVRTACCGGRIERMLCEGPRPRRTREQWQAREVMPYSWKSLVHHEVDGAGRATPSGATRIVVETGDGPLETVLEIETDADHQRSLTARTHTGSGRRTAIVWWSGEKGIRHSVAGDAATGSCAALDIRMNDTALGAAIGEAGGETLDALARALGDTGIRVDRIAKLAGHEPGRAYAQRGGLQLPFAALGRTAVALAAIHTTVAANAGATVLIDDLEAGSDAAAKALWTAIAETTRAHGTQVIAATGDRRILRAAADGDGDVVAYSRLDNTSADNPKAHRHYGAGFAHLVDYNLLD